MTVRPAETLREIQAVTEPTPLDGESLTRFYVPTDAARDTDLPPSSLLRDHLYDTPAPLRLLFASHPGAGKSTELNRLVKEVSGDFWFVHFSVRQELDIASLTYIDLILALMEQLYRRGRAENLIQDPRVIEPVRRWLSEIVIESRIAREGEAAIETSAGIDGLLAQIIGLAARIKASFSLSFESAESIRQVIRPRVVELRHYCNQVIAEINANLESRSPRRRLLVIVEDTDKLDIDLARQLFVRHTGLLADLQASMIYTVPLFLIHSPDRQRLESYFDAVILPMIKTYTWQGHRFQPGWTILSQVVTNRLNPGLIDVAALDLAIEKTGGVLRDLLRVIHSASQVARYAGAQHIGVEAIRSSLNRLKLNYRNSVYGRGSVTTEDLYDKMKEIAGAPGVGVPLDDALQLLLYTQAVIEYNGRGWYALHPLMREALQEMGKLDDLAR